mmetsp:Transcript_44614/g.112418  ORF Transcript_44614/g.112418 Transcript_44614/m.112418 type:complete len:244 (+) Transcript_44614:1060-1791(+)
MHEELVFCARSRVAHRRVGASVHQLHVVVVHRLALLGGGLGRQHLVHIDLVGFAHVRHREVIVHHLEDALAIDVAHQERSGGLAHQFAQLLLETQNAGRLLHLDHQPHLGRRRVNRHIGDLHQAGGLDGQRGTEVHERIEGDADAATALGRTHHRALELTLKQVHDHGAVAQQMSVPGLFGHHGIRAVVCFHLWYWRFLSHTVQILVQTVQQKGQQLLTVLLLKAAKLRCKLSQGRLERRRTH